MPEKISVSVKMLLALLIAGVLLQIGVGGLAFVSEVRAREAVDAASAAALTAKHDEHALRGFVKCQATFNNQFAAVTNPRSAATEARDHALTRYLDFAAQFLTPSGKPKAPTAAERKHAVVLFRRLNAASDHLDHVRATHPLPPAPVNLCGPTP